MSGIDRLSRRRACALGARISFTTCRMRELVRSESSTLLVSSFWETCQVVMREYYNRVFSLGLGISKKVCSRKECESKNQII